MSKMAVGLLAGLLSASAFAADEAPLNAVTLKLRLPTGKTAMLILQGGSMSVGMEKDNIRIELQGKASMKGETAEATGFMEMVNPVLVVEPQPAPDGLLKLVDMYASQGHHIAK